MELSAQERSNIVLDVINELKKTIQECALDERNLWTAERIGLYLGGLKKEAVLRNYACLPDFPKPCNLPNKRTLWLANEVKEWALRYQNLSAKR